MNWLKQHMNGFFKLNGIIWLIAVVINLLALYLTIGWPNNSIDTWRPDQWAAIKYFWGQGLVYCVVYLLIAALCFMRKYPVFPLMTLFLASTIHSDLANVNQVLEQGLIYPAVNLSGILGIIQFVLGLIGTVLWINQRLLSR